MTAKELYGRCPDFRAMLAAWVDAKRCPYGMGDFLDERDMPGPATAARWAATTPDRRVWEWGSGMKRSHPPSGPFPTHDTVAGVWRWWITPTDAAPACDMVPFDFDVEAVVFTATTDALLWLLDYEHWLAEVPA